MNLNSLHILNGDSTHYIFQQTNLKGNVCIWREALSDGQLHKDIVSDQFWALRQNEFSRIYNISPNDYSQKTIEEITKINQSEYSEITLWFEHDFFCQVNLIACISYLYKSKTSLSTPIFLICVGQDQIKNRNATLSDYRPDQYPMLFKNRRELSNKGISKISQLFDAFCETDPNLFFNKCVSTEDFPFLNQARFCFQKLFSEKSKTLSFFDKQCLDKAQESKSLEECVGLILDDTHDFGFGDAQVFSKLKCLEDNFISYNPIQIIQKPYQPITSDFIGNCDRSLYYFNPLLQKFFLK